MALSAWALGVVAVAALAGCAAAETARELPAGFVPDEHDGVAFAYPEGWEREPEGSGVIALGDPGVGELMPYVYVVVDDEAVGDVRGHARDMDVEARTLTQPGRSTTRDEATTLPGAQEAWILESTRPSEDGTTMLWQADLLALAQDGALVYVVVHSPVEDRDEAVTDAILASVEVRR